MEHRAIYATHAAEYDALVAREDRDGNLARRLAAIRPGASDAIEFGAGTGRVTRILANLCARVRAFDASPAMIELARARLAGVGNVGFAIADNRALPVEDSGCDLAVAGWSFGHQTAWSDDWRRDIGVMLDETMRVLRPGGTAIVIETLGTLREEPAAPSEALAAYYAMLEDERGFTRSWIRTDYEFDSCEEANRLMGFFFGPEMAAAVRARGDRVVPECTGLWWTTRR